MDKKGEMPLNKWLVRLEMVMLKKHQWKGMDSSMIQDNEEKILEADEATSLDDRPKGPFSFVCGLIDHEPTVAELIQGMVDEAEKIMKDKVKEWGLS